MFLGCLFSAVIFDFLFPNLFFIFRTGFYIGFFDKVGEFGVLFRIVFAGFAKEYM